MEGQRGITQLRYGTRTQQVDSRAGDRSLYVHRCNEVATAAVGAEIKRILALTFEIDATAVGLSQML